MTSKSLYLLVILVLFISFALGDRQLFTDPAPKKECPTTLALCELEAGNFETILDIPGETGPPGPKGGVGDPGDAGSPGKDGLQGLGGRTGPKGEVGDPGLRGPTGTDGSNGFNGAPGLKGPQGAPGEIGDQGEQGPKGLRGDPGVDGTQGPCDCMKVESVETEIGSSMYEGVSWATVAEPGKVTCKDAPKDIIDEDVYTLAIGSLDVTCDFETKKTCISNEYFDVSDQINYKESNPFWLRQKNITLTEFYSLEIYQITWLQRESSTANLTLRYHCLNSKPVGDSPALLQTWNDVTIGPKPTENTPFYYHVENDHCSTAPPNEWSSTDLVIVSPIVHRLPIKDILIQDIGKENQAFKIQVIDLCFA